MKLKIDTETINTENGLSLLRSEGTDLTKGTILHLHGLPGGKFDEYEQLHQLFAPRGYRIISYNYPGLWGAQGTFSPTNAINTTQSLISHINETYDGKIQIFAESFGAYVAIKSIEEASNINHIFHRAPLPGLDFIKDDTQFQQQLVQSMSLLIQSGVMKVEDTDIPSLLEETDGQSFQQQLDYLQSLGIKQEIIVGQDDEILPVEAIKNTFNPYATITVSDHLSHNNISRSEWIDIVTRADIFFQS